MKSLQILDLCSLMLYKGYTKTDIKSIKAFACSFPTHQEVDTARNTFLPEMETVLMKLSECTSEHQLYTIIRNQSIPIKFFLFERLEVTISSLEDLKVKQISVSDDICIGQAFTEFLQKTWESIVRTSEEMNTSLSELSLDILQSH